MGVSRVEPTSDRGVTAGGADREGEFNAAENHPHMPVGCPSHPFVSPPFVLQQLEELVDRRLLQIDPVGHLNVGGTLASACR
jgi:hypothetical protein